MMEAAAHAEQTQQMLLFRKMVAHCINIAFGWPGEPTIGQTEHEVRQWQTQTGLPETAHQFGQLLQYQHRRNLDEVRQGPKNWTGMEPENTEAMHIEATPMEDAMLEMWYRTGPAVIAGNVYHSANPLQNRALKEELLMPFGGPGQIGMEPAIDHETGALMPGHWRNRAWMREAENFAAEGAEQHEVNWQGLRLHTDRVYTGGVERQQQPITQFQRATDRIRLGPNVDRLINQYVGVGNEAQVRQSILNAANWTGGESTGVTSEGFDFLSDTRPQTLTQGGLFTPWPAEETENMVIQIVELINTSEAIGPWNHPNQAAMQIAQIVLPAFRVVMSMRIPQDITDDQETRIIRWAAALFGEMLMECITEALIDNLLQEEGLEITETHTVKQPKPPIAAALGPHHLFDAYGVSLQEERPEGHMRIPRHGSEAVPLGALGYENAADDVRTVYQEGRTAQQELPLSATEVVQLWRRYNEDMKTWNASGQIFINPINGDTMTTRQGVAAATALRWKKGLDLNWEFKPSSTGPVGKKRKR